MSTITAIIVDDEEHNRNLLSTLLKKHCPLVEVICEATNVDDAFDQINTKKPQLVFYSKAFGGSVAVILALLLLSSFGLKGLLAGMVAGQIANWFGLLSCCLYTSLLPFKNAGRSSKDVSSV